MAAKPPRESDLHAPVAAFLRGLGYEVKAEVKDCDLVGLRPGPGGADEVVVVELKRGLTIDLLVQGVKRQRNADLVYLAVPRPGRFWFDRRWRDLTHLLRRLELGLILVRLDGGEGEAVEVALDPQPIDRSRSQAQHAAKRRGLLAEFKARATDLNKGGSSRVPLMTAYRERSLALALALAEGGPRAPAALRSGKGDRKTAVLLRRNVYGWFECVGRGLYGLSESGRSAGASFAAEHPDLAARLRGAGADGPNSAEPSPPAAPDLPAAADLPTGDAAATTKVKARARSR